MNKKKVVWIINEYNGPNAGIRTRQIVLSEHLREKGYDVFIIAGSADYKHGPNYMSKNEKIKFVQHDGEKFYVIRTDDYNSNIKRVVVALQFQLRLWQLRNQIPKPDVIISDFAGLFGNIALKWKKKYNTKVIFDILDLWPELFVDMGHMRKNSIVTKALYKLEHKSYREADSIVFSFEGGKQYIIDKGWSKEFGGDVDTENIGYLNNGVDLKTVDKQTEDFQLVDNDLENDKFKVVYLGSVSEFNGLDVLVLTAKELQDRSIQDVDILVYGYGNQEERLKKMCSDLQLRNIKFKGALDKKYAMNLLSRSDLTLFTFKNTNLLKYGVSPNKLFMYFASGKPVLSMIKPEYDLVEGNKAGMSVDNNPESIANAIEKFKKMDKSEYSVYCKNSRRLAEEYDYKKLVNVLIEHIER
ncbi:glycosyltransferase family 4 protein [Clostridium polynesiense]|uniref:glycosyltransferase family 4 protein n=1 Tax=Clostridium polynesiense TaxID=1325933 RepID=UPI00058BD8F5|nr:glycosyltransferase family 4 protein [Clostridium polynesiense]